MSIVRFKYTGTALPANSDTENLFSTVVADPTGKNFFSNADLGQFKIDVVNSHAGTLKVYKSDDRGTNWNQIDEIALAAAASGDSHVVEFDVQGYQDWKLDWLNGGTTQTTFEIDLSASEYIVGLEDTSAGGGSGAAATEPWKVDVTLTLDTNVYASGDLIADTQEIAGAVLTSGGSAILESIEILDEDAQGVAFTIYITGASTSFGTENSAPNISDANLRNVQRKVNVITADYDTVSGAKVADVPVGLSVTGTGTSLYFAVVNGTGAPTYTASGMRFKFWFRAA